MKSPVLSATFIAIICSVSFIIGFIINDHYQPNNKLIIETINQTSMLQKLLNNHSMIIQTEVLLNEVGQIYSKEDQEAFAERLKKKLLFEISQFQRNYKYIKNTDTRLKALEGFVSEVSVIEKKYKKVIKQ